MDTRKALKNLIYCKVLCEGQETSRASLRLKPLFWFSSIPKPKVKMPNTVTSWNCLIVQCLISKIRYTYSRVPNKHTGTLLIFEVCSRGYILIREGYVYWFLIFKKSFKNFQLSFPLAMYKRVKLSAN